MTLRIVPLYPELLSIYADRGNVRVLEQRARWRGIPVEVSPSPSVRTSTPRRRTRS